MSDAAVPASTTHPTLEADITAALGPRSIVLVGMMGAGKSTIGRRMAARLKLPFRLNHVNIYLLDRKSVV